MNSSDMNVLKYYLKKYFHIDLYSSKESIISISIFLKKKHKVTIEEYLHNQKLATEIENEFYNMSKEEEQSIVVRGNQVYFQNKHNKNLYLVVDEFST